ncbi:MAG TPA: hypothetical protein VMK13_04685 [Streptosporangiaceae bacterium]|nr:hypothetical protein [Streptosporangiaceae bacterium]
MTGSSRRRAGCPAVRVPCRCKRARHRGEGLNWRRQELGRILGQLEVPSDQIAAAARALAAFIQAAGRGMRPGEGYGTVAAGLMPW